MRFAVTLLDVSANVEHWSIVEADTQREAFLAARDQIADSIADGEGVYVDDDAEMDRITSGIEFSAIELQA
jgi:hypothetical protein